MEEGEEDSVVLVYYNYMDLVWLGFFYHFYGLRRWLGFFYHFYGDGSAHSS